MSCSKKCHHDFFLSIFQILISPDKYFKFYFPGTTGQCYLLSFAVSTHLFPLVVLVKQNREITRLALSEITETAFGVSWAEGAVFFTGLSVIKQAAHSSVNITSQAA